MLIFANQQRIIIRRCGSPQLNRALLHLLADCFGIVSCNITVMVHSHQHCFQLQQVAVFSKALMNPLYTTCPEQNYKQTKLATNWSDSLEGKEPNIAFRSWWKNKIELKGE